VTRTFFPHGLGHSLGLQCHDVGCAEIKPKAENPFLRMTTTIAPGQVFTVEPGVYFIDTLLAPLRAGPHAGRIDWSLVDALAPLGGVRIEDDVHVAPAGAPLDNLTRAHLP
jgi:Xaa-Pro dipeptidase